MKSNPESIVIKSYLQPDRAGDRIRTYIFPEGRQITREEAREFCAIFYTIGYGEQNTMKCAKNWYVCRQFKRDVEKHAKRFFGWQKRNS